MARKKICKQEIRKKSLDEEDDEKKMNEYKQHQPAVS